MQLSKLMNRKLFRHLLLFSLCGLALWFFGNLYEAIVIAPNMLKDSARKMRDWQDFFDVTNPVYFYIPVAPAALFTLVYLFLRTKNDDHVLKRFLKISAFSGILAFVLGIYIITRVNFKLFFGDLEKYSADAYQLAVLWNVLNIVRLFLAGVSVMYVFKAYVWARQSESEA
jgi:hypothetical protein